MGGADGAYTIYFYYFRFDRFFTFIGYGSHRCNSVKKRDIPKMEWDKFYFQRYLNHEKSVEQEVCVWRRIDKSISSFLIFQFKIQKAAIAVLGPLAFDSLTKAGFGLAMEYFKKVLHFSFVLIFFFQF